MIISLNSAVLDAGSVSNSFNYLTNDDFKQRSHNFNYYSSFSCLLFPGPNFSVSLFYKPIRASHITLQRIDTVVSFNISLVLYM